MATRRGWKETTSDWPEAVSLHAEMAIGAAEASKIVLREMHFK